MATTNRSVAATAKKFVQVLSTQEKQCVDLARVICAEGARLFGAPVLRFSVNQLHLGGRNPRIVEPRDHGFVDLCRLMAAYAASRELLAALEKVAS